MANLIPQTFIDELLSRADIVEVIDSRVPLRHKGREYVACCPFHDEKTPSFSVSPVKQFYYCFGCGAGGSAINFLMAYERFSFSEAVEELASRYGLPLPVISNKVSAQTSASGDLFQLMNRVKDFYQAQVKKTEYLPVVKAFAQARGLQGDTFKTFEMGYAPPLRQFLAKQFQDDITLNQMVKLGLLFRKSGGQYEDRFRHRIIFPIYDHRGRCVGFGGRSLGDEQPKYLNSPDSQLFHKGKEVYNLDKARRQIKEDSPVIVVEGYMDTVMLHQQGLTQVVATMGTATTHYQLERLFAITPRIVFCFDGDRAGLAAAWRALLNVLPYMEKGRQVNFMFLPQGEDPDSFVRTQGLALFQELMAKSVPLSKFLFEQLGQKVDTNSREGQAQWVERAVPHLAKIPAGVFREMMIRELAQHAMVSETKIEAILSQFGQSTQVRSHKLGDKNTSVWRGSRPDQPWDSQVRHAIRLILFQPNLVNLVKHRQELLELALPGITMLINLIDFLQENPHIPSGVVVSQWPEEQFQLAQELTWQPLIENGFEQEFLGVIQRLVRRYHEQRVDILRQKSRCDGLTEEEKHRLEQLLRQIHPTSS